MSDAPLSTNGFLALIELCGDLVLLANVRDGLALQQMLVEDFDISTGA